MSNANNQKNPILVWLTIVTFLAAVVAIFIFVPTEQTEGAVQRIMYFHIPAAWLAFFAFFIVFSQQHSFFMEEGEGVGYLCSGFCRDWRNFLFAGFDHRADLGKTYLGGMVGMGRPPDVHADIMAHLCVVPDASLPD